MKTLLYLLATTTIWIVVAVVVLAIMVFLMFVFDVATTISLFSQ